MKGRTGKISIIIFFLSALFSGLYGQSYIIDYYGINYEAIDSNMAKMTSDLYYTQLCEIPNFTVNDRRIDSSKSFSPDQNIFSEDNLTFYTEVKRITNSSKWETIIHVLNKKEESEHTKRNEYDSFYKILMESKTTLQTSIKNLIENKQEDLPDQNDSIFSNSNEVVSSEILSGTWKGEDFIDKIVILRGGRGFIIFKNGASMNILISISEESGKNYVKVTQNGRSNASFFPELPRPTALVAAVSADPIEWTLLLNDMNTLTGTKKTLLPEQDSYSVKTVNVTWNRIN